MLERKLSLKNKLSKAKRFYSLHFFNSGFISLFILTFIIFISATRAYSDQATLSWDANSESDLAGYNLYYGNSSGFYDVSIDVGNQSSYTVSGLVSDNTYYFALTSYDIDGNESGYSDEIIHNITTPVNNLPVLSSIGNKSVNEEQSLNFTVSATDADGDTLNYIASNIPSGASFDENTKTFSWTPTYNQAGTYSNITFQASDGTDTDSESITITVYAANRAPVLDSIADITVNEGDTITLNPTATDPDGGSLTFTYSGWMSSSSYTTDYNDAGTYIVTITVSDGSLTDSQDVNIIVNDVGNNDVGGNDGGSSGGSDGGSSGGNDGGSSGGGEEPTCEYSISSEEETFTSDGGTGSVVISTEDGCEWTAISNNGWITITSGSGSGVGTVEYFVSENASESSRTSYFTITGDDYTATVTVTQEGTTDDGDDDGDSDGGSSGGEESTCEYSLSSTEGYFTAVSGTGSLNVTTDNGCEWTAVSNVDWITVTKVTYAIATTGNGTIEYSVSENTGSSPRTGTMTIAERIFMVTQAASGSLSPDIKANNSDGPITIGTDGNLSIKISLSAADRVGGEGDWWLVASTPSGLKSYDLDQGFVPGLTVTHQGAIFDLDSITILDTSGLDAGTYVYFFGIDLDMDGDLDMDEGLLYHDSVEVTVEEGVSGGGSLLLSPAGLSVSVSGNALTLSWDAVDDAEGYKLYYGTSSGDYTGTIDLGNLTGVFFDNIPDGTYYLAITAYADGEESGYSEEASVTIIPAPTG